MRPMSDYSRIIERWADFFPSKTAIHFHGVDYSYALLWQRIEQATQGLAGAGVSQGDRVAFLGYNHPEMIVLLMALARLGGILVPLNWRLAAAEHAYILGDCSPKVVIAEPGFQAGIDSIRAGLQPAVYVSLGPAAPAWATWDSIRAQTANVERAGSDSDDLLLVYTSGTTGRPKGAVLTQSALLWNGFNSIHAHDMRQADHVLSTLPMFHVGGLNNQTLPALQAGATVTLHRRFEPGPWLADVVARRPTLSILVPATMAAVIADPAWAGSDLSSLRLLATGSSVIPESLIRAFHARNLPVTQIYGSTETAPIATVLLREDAQAYAGSAGKPAPHCEVRIVDSAERDVSPGEFGEIWVRGPNVMRGYWNNPQATQAALRDGWFRTGDVARRDRHGYFWVVGRSNDLIISGGENIYPAELENVLADCPDVAECAVVGVEDAKWGEAACACIVKKQDADLNEAGVLGLFRDRLARFKHPRRVVFLDALPKTAMGKVQKFELKRLISESAK